MNIAVSPANFLGESGNAIDDFAVEHGHTKVMVCGVDRDPVDHLSLFVFTSRTHIIEVEIVIKVGIAEGGMGGVINISIIRFGHLGVGQAYEAAWFESEIVEDDKVTEHGTPELDPTHISISLCHKCHCDHMFFFVARFAGHKVEFA